MKENCCSLRGIIHFAVIVSLIILPVPSAFSADGDGPFSGSRRVTTGKLPPPGAPVPGVNAPAPGMRGPVPAPPPAPSVDRRHHPPVVVERHREYRGHDPRWEHHRRWERGWHRHGWDHHRVYRSLPAGAFAFFLGGAAFYYYYGTYYRQTGDGYVVVEAPIGARVRVLPDYCTVFSDEGRRYYACDNIYYESVGDEYVVIEGPPPGYRWPEAEIGEEVSVVVDRLNLRSGPDRSYPVIGVLNRGEVVEVSGKEGPWYYIRLQGGTYGWIMKEHARLYRTRVE